MKTVKKLVSLLVIACLLGGVAVSFSGCGLSTRTAGTVDGEDIPAGMYIYFLHSALYSLEQQYQYGQLSSEYSDESSEESSVESSVESSEEPADESSEEAADASSEESSEEADVESSSAETESSSEESVDTKPATIWDAIVENKTAKDYVIDKAYEN